MSSLSIVGGGVIGLSVAWRAAEAGWAVTIHDPQPARGASWVAGGMLAPLTEGWPGEERALELGTNSLRRWPEFADRLRQTARLPSGLHERGTIVVGVDAADAEELRTLATWLARRGRKVDTLTRLELRRREPSVASNLRLALDVPEDLSVDNRALLAALQSACASAGVQIAAERIDRLSALRADQIVLSAGVGSAALHPSARVRPVKGEILRLRARPSCPPPPRHTVRGVVHGRHVYVVPREGGIVVGATQYEAGQDRDVTIGGVRDLVVDADAVLLALGEYALDSAAAGLRPVTPDNLPLIGRVDPRTVLATGHGRNGLLLAPLTADAVLAELDGTTMPEVAVADPRRYS